MFHGCIQSRKHGGELVPIHFYHEDKSYAKRLTNRLPPWLIGQPNVTSRVDTLPKKVGYREATEKKSSQPARPTQTLEKDCVSCHSGKNARFGFRRPWSKISNLLSFVTMSKPLNISIILIRMVWVIRKGRYKTRWCRQQEEYLLWQAVSGGASLEVSQGFLVSPSTCSATHQRHLELAPHSGWKQLQESHHHTTMDGTQKKQQDYTLL